VISVLLHTLIFLPSSPSFSSFPHLLLFVLFFVLSYPSSPSSSPGGKPSAVLLIHFHLHLLLIPGEKPELSFAFFTSPSSQTHPSFPSSSFSCFPFSFSFTSPSSQTHPSPSSSQLLLHRLILPLLLLLLHLLPLPLLLLLLQIKGNCAVIS
jgi:hypothetical protein